MNLFMVSGDTGVGRGVSNIFRHTLQELSRHWDAIDVCVPPVPGAEPQTLFGNVHVHPCDRAKLFFPSFVVDVGRRVRAERQIDVVTAHSYPFFLNEMGAQRVARESDALYVVEVMHVVGYPLATDADEWLRFELARRTYARVCRGADLVRVINSREVPDFLIAAGVPREKILVRPCFYLDFERFHPTSDREFLGKRILYSGRLAKNKGLRELCEAIARVRRSREVSFTVLGDGELKPQLRAWIQELGLDDVTTLLGHVPHTELGDLYRDADVLVMPSKNEGGPRVTLEAMACGTPVISTRVGIMHEVLTHGETGLFCDWSATDIAAQLERVLGDEELARRLSAHGPPAVAHFEYASVIADYANAYLEAARMRQADEEVTALRLAPGRTTPEPTRRES